MTQRDYELTRKIVADRSGDWDMMNLMLDVVYSAIDTGNASHAFNALMDAVLVTRYVLIADKWIICPKGKKLKVKEDTIELRP